GSPVSFAATATAGAAASITAVSGSNQAGTVGLALAQPFVVKVKDSFANPVAGAAVSFTAPATGSITVAASTVADGTTSAIATLPTISGTAAFSASVAGVAGTASFNAQAAAGAPASLALTGLPAS